MPGPGNYSARDNTFGGKDARGFKMGERLGSKNNENPGPGQYN